MTATTQLRAGHSAAAWRIGSRGFILGTRRQEADAKDCVPPGCHTPYWRAAILCRRVASRDKQSILSDSRHLARSKIGETDSWDFEGRNPLRPLSIARRSCEDILCTAILPASPRVLAAPGSCQHMTVSRDSDRHPESVYPRNPSTRC